jgi:hypothetical protein
MRETRHRANKPSGAFGLRRRRPGMLAPLRGSGSKTLLDMLIVVRERTQSPLDRHAKMPHGLNAASRKARGTILISFTVKGEVRVSFGVYVITNTIIGPTCDRINPDSAVSASASVIKRRKATHGPIQYLDGIWRPLKLTVSKQARH